MARPDAVDGKTWAINTGCGKMYVTINHLNGEPFEVFVRLGKAGGCASSQTEALGRLISLGLRRGIDLNAIISELSQISCHQPCFSQDGKVLSCADALSNILRRLTETPVEEEIAQPAGACPDCGATLVRTEGCLSCGAFCGYSKCG